MKIIKAMRQSVPLRYLFSGGTAAFVNLFVLYILVSFLHEWYVLSTVIAFIAAFITSFLMQKFLTFSNRTSHRVHIQLVSYLGISLINLGINVWTIYLAVHVWGINYLFAQFIITGSIAVYSYFLYKYVVFRNKKPQEMNDPLPL